MVLREFIVLFLHQTRPGLLPMRQQCESYIDIDSNAVSKLVNGSNVDLPFAMFSHQYESKAIKLYYSMSTISYTPWFSYQINMTLIECSRIWKDRLFAWRSDSGPP